MTRRSLTDRVAAITGGERGIGKAIAAAMVAKGMRVAVGDLDPGARDYPLDVTDPASFAAFLDAVEADLGPLDVLVNNAGIMPVGRFVDEEPAATARQIDTNVRGVVTGCRLALARMTHGHVVNVASAVGKGGYPGIATYSGTKAFVIAFSEALRAEVAGGGVEISCVIPGMVNTELASGIESPRGIRNAEPREVAAAVIDVLERPRFAVYVPRSVGPTVTLMPLLPRRLRDAAARLLKADRIMLDADRRKRAAYEARAARGPTPPTRP
jgi:NADP-dependent 3-hydroxy acid dehydrogenase YdfG